MPATRWRPCLQATSIQAWQVGPSGISSASAKASSRESNTYPELHSSGSTIRPALAPTASSIRSTLRRTFRSFSPTTGAIWTQAIFTTASSRPFRSLIDTSTGRIVARNRAIVPADTSMAARWQGILTVTTLLAAGLAASPVVLDDYAQQILAQAFFFAIAAITVDLLWGYTGILTFGQSAFFGIGVYTVALALAYYVEGTLATAGVIVAAMLVAALVGAGVGWLSFWDRASPIYVAIVTLALPVVFTQIILSGGAYTGSSSGLPIPVPALSLTQWYWVAGGLLLLVAAGGRALVSSDAGRLLVAIRENEERCRYLGLETSRLKIRLMAACSAVAALAGAFYVLFGSVAAHSYGDFVFGTELVVWTALGGRGTLLGPILGTVGVNYVSALLGGNLPFVWLLFVGFAFVLVVVYLPQGLVPAIGHGMARLGGAFERASRRGDRARKAPAAAVLAVTAMSGRRPDAVDGAGLAATESPVLALRGVSKRYGSLQVLDGVSLEARRGEVIGIVGPNGAGKTTLLRCIADGRERSSGEVVIDGHRIDGLPPHACVRLGVSRKFQAPNVFDALTVLDCLRVARSYRVPASPWRRSQTLEL